MTARDDLLDTIVWYADDYSNHVVYRETTLLDVEASLDAYAAKIWDEAYKQGVNDQRTSHEVYNGEIAPARANPHRS